MADSSPEGCLLTPASPTGAGDGDGASDVELIRRYRRTRSAEDFAEISRRHWPMVLRTSMRLVGNVHDAEDVAQSAFLALAQRPEAVRRSLAGYLHESARASASELFRSRRRRARREGEVARRDDPDRQAPGGEDRDELREELDSALAQLPDALKQAVILRHLEGHSQQEAARRAGCTPVAMGWRSMKGLEKLRTILGRRGVGTTGGALAAALAVEAQSGATAGAAVVATGKVAAAGKAAAGLTAQALIRKSVFASLARQVAACLAILVPLTVGVGLKLAPAPTPAPAPAVAAAPAPPAFRPTIGAFDRNLDVGRPARAGSAEFADGRYLVQASGAHIYLEEDHFRFVCRPWEGDGEVVARVAIDPNQPNQQVAAGVMFRERLEASSLHAAILVTKVESRATWRSPKTLPLSKVAIDDLPARGVQWVRLARRGDRFTMSVRPDSDPDWTVVKELDLPMARSAYVGIAVTSNDDTHLSPATFDQVSIGP